MLSAGEETIRPGEFDPFRPASLFLFPHCVLVLLSLARLLLFRALRTRSSSALRACSQAPRTNASLKATTASPAQTGSRCATCFAKALYATSSSLPAATPVAMPVREEEVLLNAHEHLLWCRPLKRTPPHQHLVEYDSQVRTHHSASQVAP